MLNGYMKLQLAGEIIDLPAGHLHALDRALEHDLEAFEESAVLLTISWPKGEE
jgi:hypothetical protein